MSLAFNYESLVEHAIGRLSSIFGSSFADLDHFEKRTRLPSPPFLLLDRVISMEVDKKEMKGSRIVAELDLLSKTWFLDECGRIPYGFLAEAAGQPVLLLLSSLGIDHGLRGGKVFRLLNADVCITSASPQRGETIRLEVVLENIISMNDSSLFVFHTKGMVGNRILGQGILHAGYFTYDELKSTTGITSAPYEGVEFSRQGSVAISNQQLAQLAKGDLAACFGERYHGAEVKGGMKRFGALYDFIEEILEINETSGPCGLGYLKARKRVSGDEWYFKYHFKNDPVMPGTMMYQACLQLAETYLLYRKMVDIEGRPSFSLELNAHSKFMCRGQVSTDSKEVIYELSVEKVIPGPKPGIQVSVQVFCDGVRIFLLKSTLLFIESGSENLQR